MSEFIVRAEETDLFFLFKDFEELTRSKNCVWYKPEDDGIYGQCQAIFGSYVTVENRHYCAWAKKK